MTSYWTNFAKRGDPNGRGLPQWPHFAESDPRGMVLGERIRAGLPFDASRLEKIDAAYAAAARARSN